MRAALILVLITSGGAYAADRPTAVYGQAGVSKNYASFSGQGGDSSYEGGGVDAEAGLDWLTGTNSGFNLAGIYAKANLSNSANNTSQSETGESTSFGGKLGFYVGPLTIGGGFRQLEFKATAVTSNNNNSSTSVKGDETFAFVGMSFNIGGKFRSTIEVNYGQGQAGGAETKATAIVLRIGILHDLK